MELDFIIKEYTEPKPTIAILIYQKSEKTTTLNRLKKNENEFTYSSNIYPKLLQYSFPEEFTIQNKNDQKEYQIHVLYPSRDDFSFNVQHIIFPYFLILKHTNNNPFDSGSKIMEKLLELVLITNTFIEKSENQKVEKIIKSEHIFSSLIKKMGGNDGNFEWIYNLILSISNAIVDQNDTSMSLVDSCFEAYIHQNDFKRIADKSNINMYLSTIYSKIITTVNKESNNNKPFIRFIIACISPDLQFEDKLNENYVENDIDYYFSVQALIEYFLFKNKINKFTKEKIQSPIPFAYIMVKYLSNAQNCFIFDNINNNDNLKKFQNILNKRGYKNTDFSSIHQSVKDQVEEEINQQKLYLESQLNSCIYHTKRWIGLISFFHLCKDQGFDMKFYEKMFPGQYDYTKSLNYLKLLLTEFEIHKKKYEQNTKSIYEKYQSPDKPPDFPIRYEHIFSSLIEYLKQTDDKFDFRQFISNIHQTNKDQLSTINLLFQLYDKQNVTPYVWYEKMKNKKYFDDDFKKLKTSSKNQ